MTEGSSSIKQKRSSVTNNKAKVEISNPPIGMEELEKRQLSQHIGIDYEMEKEKYNWFLSQVRKTISTIYEHPKNIFFFQDLQS